MTNDHDYAQPFLICFRFAMKRIQQPVFAIRDNTRSARTQRNKRWLVVRSGRIGQCHCSEKHNREFNERFQTPAPLFLGRT